MGIGIGIGIGVVLRRGEERRWNGGEGARKEGRLYRIFIGNVRERGVSCGAEWYERIIEMMIIAP